MITEPEMWDEPEAGRPADVLSDTDAPPLGPGRRRPWLLALGGAVVASALWTAALHGAGPGDSGPDLHGYHVTTSPCARSTLKPLSDATGAVIQASSPATVHKGPALEEVFCTASASAPAGPDRTTMYSITVSVELHRKTDPRAEFENQDHLETSALPDPEESAGSGDLSIAVISSGLGPVTKGKPVHGLGDSAYLVSDNDSDQSLEVLRGGVVLSLTVSAFDNWTGPGLGPSDAEGGRRGSGIKDLGPVMATTMRHLMSVLAH